MKLRDTDKAILLFLAGIAACVLSFLYIAKPQIEQKKTLDTEITQLQVRLADLQSKAANRETYENGIIEYTEKYEAILNRFPADLNQEITIMFLDGVKESNEFSISSLGMGEKSPIYSLISGTTAAPAETAETSETAETVLVENDATLEDTSLVCYKAVFPIAYKGSYSDLKDVVNYIDNYSDRMTVDTLDIAQTGEGVYSGNLQLSCYSIEGTSRPARSLELNDVEIGVDNIFVGGSGSSSSGVSLNKYDDMDGAAIESSYDFYTMLNASTSDVSAKIIGQNGTGKDATVITNSENTTSTISYDFYEVDGKVYCKYTLDGDQSYEAEVTSAEDVKIVIQSSERKNDSDQVGAKITVKNSTSMPVYVKVSGDDSVAPRVSVAKTGLVKIYQ